MQAKRNDDLKDSFYLYIMRNSVGAGLRSQYALNGHMPDRLAELLQALDAGHEKEKAAGAGEEEKPPPAQKPLRKQ
jgi:hypothetical protein